MSEKDIALFQHEDFLELRDSILLDIPHGVQLTTDEVIAHLHGLQNLVKRVPLALEIILREIILKYLALSLKMFMSNSSSRDHGSTIFVLHLNFWAIAKK